MNVRSGVIELHVHPVRPGEAKDAAPAAAEFLESSHFIDCDDARVKELAQQGGRRREGPVEEGAAHRTLGEAEHAAR